MCESTVPKNVIVFAVVVPKSTSPFASNNPVNVVLPVTPKVPPNVALPDISATPLISNEPPSTSPDAVMFTAPVNEPLDNDAVPSVSVGASSE